MCAHADTTRRLEELVKANLAGELVNWHMVEDLPGEQAFIVRTRIVADEKYAVHRAVLARNEEAEPNSMLVWGDYFDGTFSAPKSLMVWRERADVRC